MRLKTYLTERGNLLFRWRSYIPLLLVPLLYLERNSIHSPYNSDSWNLVFELSCLAISLVGVFFRIKTIGHIPRGTSGRNSRRQEASELNTSGMYSVVRNPLYVGNYLMYLGVTMMTQSWELIVIVTFLFATTYLTIILKEEEFLSEQFGSQFQQYTKEVPCFIPNFRLWRPADLPFSFRMVLRREHDSWMSIMTAFVVLGFFREYMIHGQITFDNYWSSVGRGHL